MIDAYFKSSDKIREFSGRIVLLSILSVFFEYYKVNIDKIPFVDVPYPQSSGPDGYVPTISVIFFVGAVYYFLVLIGLLVGEYAEYDDKKIVELISRAKAGDLTSSTVDASPDIQRALSGLLDAHDNNLTMARVGSILRLITDIILPAISLIIAGYFEWRNTVALIAKLLHL